MLLSSLTDNLLYQLEGGERHVLDENVPLKPSFRRTWPVASILWLVGLARGGKGANTDSNAAEGEGDNEVPSDETSDEPKAKISTGTALPASKTGGRRRKGGKR